MKNENTAPGFSDRRTTRLGEIAEDIVVTEMMEERGWTPYLVGCDCPAVIDLILCKPQVGGGYELISMDVKSKPRLYTRPATGIDRCYLDDYEVLLSAFPVYLMFVDSFERGLYSLDLRKKWDQQQAFGDMVIWDLVHMQAIRPLSRIELRKLSKYETYSKDNYEDVQPHFNFF